MLEKMAETIRRFGMLEKTGTVLVACSGGPDSMALLYGLLRLKDNYPIRLVGFHLNHRLRGLESSADERFVRQIFKDLKIPLTVQKADVARHADIHKLSLEEAARKVRYRLLETTAQKYKADRIALGHNLNDHAETVLLNLIRGTGTSGLAGIPPVRAIPPSRRTVPLGRTVVRPLIETSREEIMKFLTREKIPFRTDSSNFDLRIPRNFIRRRLIPLCRNQNPRFLEAVTRTTRILADDEQCLADLSLQARKQAVRPLKNGFYLDIRVFNTYNDAIKRRIIKLLKPDLDFIFIQKIIDAAGGISGKTVILPDRWFAVKEYSRLYLGRTGVSARPMSVCPLPVGKPVRWADWRVSAHLTDRCPPRRKPRGHPSEWSELFDCDRLALPIVLRARKPGDRFQPFGRASDKKLKEILIDDKIPRRCRDRLPLLCDRSGILWILGGRRSQRAAVGPQTKKFLVVEAVRLAELPAEGGAEPHGQHG